MAWFKNLSNTGEGYILASCTASWCKGTSKQALCPRVERGQCFGVIQFPSQHTREETHRNREENTSVMPAIPLQQWSFFLGNVCHFKGSTLWLFTSIITEVMPRSQKNYFCSLTWYKRFIGSNISCLNLTLLLFSIKTTAWDSPQS